MKLQKRKMVLFSMVLVLSSFFLTVLVLCAALLRLRQFCRKSSTSGGVVLGFFHPYCNSGGGGERVLWCAIKALEAEKESLRVVIYTGDVASAEEIIGKVKSRFGIDLAGMPIEFVRLKLRHWVEAKRYPRLTLIGQSLGSMVLAFEALSKRIPDVFVDTTGYAFTFPVAYFLAGSTVATYTHYPTISTDMLSVVRERRPTYNNAGGVTSSWAKTYAKLAYYHAFAFLYGLVGRCAAVVMVNSTWTRNHVAAIWGGRRVSVVYPPCDTSGFRKQALAHSRRVRDKFVVSVGQFRPEKDHLLQLKAFAALRKRYPDAYDGARLVVIGGCRHAEDQALLDSLKAAAKEEGVAEQVDWLPNLPYADLQAWLGKATAGLHTMWNEHFGIGVVEMMAAGMVTIAHNSGGPRSDIIRHGHTGFLAATADEYADALATVLNDDDCIIVNEADAVEGAGGGGGGGEGGGEMPSIEEIRVAGREASERYSEEVFMADFRKRMEPVLPYRNEGSS